MRIRKSSMTVEAETERLADAALLALKMKDGTMIQEICRRALETKKGKETDSTLEFPEEMQRYQIILEF